jgi:hypothetical protein
MQAVRTHALLSRLLTELMQQLRSPPNHINSLLPLSALEPQLQRNALPLLHFYRLVSQ